MGAWTAIGDVAVVRLLTKFSCGHRYVLEVIGEVKYKQGAGILRPSISAVKDSSPSATSTFLSVALPLMIFDAPLVK